MGADPRSPGQSQGELISLFALGGTIAMKAAGADGAKLALGAADLGLREVADGALRIETHDVACKPSASLTFEDHMALVAAIRSARSSGTAASVVTQGTDTLEETAFLLDIMLGDDFGAVVCTAAMRRSDERGADGLANLHAAIAVARTPIAAKLGPVVVMDDQIHAAQWVRKAHGSRLGGAFISAPMGPLGWICEGRSSIAMIPRRARLRLNPAGSPPPVAILLAGHDLEPRAVEAIAPACGGLIIAATGAGHVSAAAAAALKAAAQVRPIILASRTAEGGLCRATYGYAGAEIDLLRGGLISAGALSPQKARVLLQLLLASHAPRSAIVEAFDAFELRT